jgi:beta-glucanase (GH16 family)
MMMMAASLVRPRLGIICVTVLAGCASASSVTSTPATGWKLTWSDEFDGAAGASFDRAKWAADTGGQGFGNQEREFYTTNAENIALDGAGHLVITARAEAPTRYACWYGGCRYSSARIKTQGLFAQSFGRFEARIRIPRGQGLWPAFWMLGNDIGNVGWPACGEIDIMENIGREPTVVHGTMHGPGYSGANGIGGPDSIASGAFADAFHVYAVEWTPQEIRWFVDDHQYFRTTPGSLPSGARWVYDHPFFLLLNLAVGGAWPNDPDATTAFPAQMLVDYVRVYSPGS